MPLDGLDAFNALSGAADDVIASHNASGPYFRPRSPVTVPNTPAQQLIQAAITYLTSEWRYALSQEQRDGWITYARQLNQTDTYPYQKRALSGFNAFIRTNCNRLAFNSEILYDAPRTFTPLQVPVVTVAQSTIFPQLTVTLTDLNNWLSTNYTHLWIFASAPQPLTVNRWWTPFNHVATVNGNHTAPPPATKTITLDQVPDDDAHVFLRFVFADALGNVSRPVITKQLVYVPPVPIKTHMQGNTIWVTFSKALDPAHIPTPSSQLTPRRVPRTATTSRPLIAPFTVGLNDWNEVNDSLTLLGTQTTFIGSPAAIGYLSEGAQQLTRAAFPLQVADFTLPIPYDA